MLSTIQPSLIALSAQALPSFALSMRMPLTRLRPQHRRASTSAWKNSLIIDLPDQGIHAVARAPKSTIFNSFMRLIQPPMLPLYSIPPNIKELDLTNIDGTFGFKAATIKGLTKLAVWNLNGLMEFHDMLDCLFVHRNPQKLPYPKAGMLCLHAADHKRIESMDNIGVHYLYHYGERIQPERLVSQKYDTVGDQVPFKAFGYSLIIIKRVPKKERLIAMHMQNMERAMKELKMLQSQNKE